jgi:hypothetical protein
MKMEPLVLLQLLQVVLDILHHQQLRFMGLSTVSAAATAVVSAAGTISAIHIRNAGVGYTVTPTISIASPGSSGSGNL